MADKIDMVPTPFCFINKPFGDQRLTYKKMSRGLLNMPEDRLMSEVFDYLRFPLIIGVIFIHNASSTILTGGQEFGDVGELPIFYYVSTFFSQVISRIAVPLFFLMSGYLFFYKVETFDNSIYLQKLRKRFKSLFVPFFLWTTFFLLTQYIMSNTPPYS